MNTALGRPKTLEEIKRSLRNRLSEHRNPMRFCDKEQAVQAIERLNALDGGHWASIWGSVGAAFEEAAEKAEAKGDLTVAEKARFQAYAFYYVGRYPCPNHSKKKECARKARENFVAASRSFDPPLERFVIPFKGRQGEGNEIVFYLGKPKGIDRTPVVISWGGVDGYKEERYVEFGKDIIAAGIAILLMDMPGTGESPIYGSINAERQLEPVLKWVQQRPDLDGYRIAFIGSSFGGYWATKVAHTHREYLKAAVNWGGGVHYNFQADWTEKSRYPVSSLLDLAGTRAFTFNLSYEEYVAFAPKLSLLDQGLLDQPCAPLLLINGKEDELVPIQDFYLLLEHGDPKNIRIFPGGHMGQTPSTLPTVVKWLTDRLGGHLIER